MKFLPLFSYLYKKGQPLFDLADLEFLFDGLFFYISNTGAS